MALGNNQQWSSAEWVEALSGIQGEQKQQQAYGKLGDLIYIQLFNYLRKMRGQQRFAKQLADGALEDASQELVQITLIKVHQDQLYQEYSGKNGAQFTTYITGIALRKAIDYIRKEWRYEFVSLDGGNSTDQEPNSLSERIDFASPNPETEQFLQEFWQDFRDCVGMLDKNRQLVLIWREQDGLGFDEIAERLKKTKNAAFQLLFHAKTKIRDCLTNKQWTLDDISQLISQPS